VAVDQSAMAAQLTAGIAAVNEVLSTVGSLQNTKPAVLSTVYAAVQNALAPFDDAIAAFDADIDTASVGGVTSGLPAPQLSAALLVQATDIEQQGRLVLARAFLSRAGVNLQNAPG
jgi:hypothetical protein